MSYETVFSGAMSMIEPVFDNLGSLIPIVVIGLVLGFIGYIIKR